MPGSAQSSHRPFASPLTLADLTADLVWPKLLRVGHFALRPARLGLSFVLVIGVLLLVLVGGGIGQKGGENPLASSGAVVAIGVAAMPGGDGAEQWGERPARQLSHMFFGEPWWMIRHHPWIAFLVLPLLLGWTVVIGGAICRSAACDVGQGVSIGWTRAIGFALSRWRSLVLSVALPLLIIWGLALGMAIAGWALFSLPVVNLLGALAWPCFLFGGFAAAVIVVVFVFGFPMLVPSVACEGTDAIDAVQHAYAFVFARPLRLAIYLLILLAELVVMVGLVAIICRLGIHIAHSAAGAWSDGRGRMVLSLPAGERPEGLSGVSIAARWIVMLWTGLATAIPAAFVVSYFWCGSTMLYLAMRRVVDGQDFAEIWMPGVVEGTRAASAAAESSPAQPGESVSESGPADAE